MSPSLIAFLSHISTVIWLFVLFLVLLFLASVVSMLYSQVRLRRRLNSFATSLTQLVDEEPKDKTRGLSLAKLDAIRVSLESLDGLPKAWWTRVNRSIHLYVNQEEEDGWFITEPAGEQGLRGRLPPRPTCQQANDRSQPQKSTSVHSYLHWTYSRHPSLWPSPAPPVYPGH